jgi:hypothetical protein
MVDVPSGRVAYVVLSFGGILGMGNKLFAMPWSAARVDEDRKCLILDVDKRTLESAPGFDKDNWPDKNRILAIPTAVPAMTPKPSTPAMSAMIRNTSDQWSIVSSSFEPDIRRFVKRTNKPTVRFRSPFRHWRSSHVRAQPSTEVLNSLLAARLHRLSRRWRTGSNMARPSPRT